MAAALLAKLKINKPPVGKQEMEINLPAKREPGKGMELAKGMEPVLNIKEPVLREALPLPLAEPTLNIIDERERGAFDRNTFLKTFKNPKVLLEPVGQAKEPVGQAKEPAVRTGIKKQITRKRKVIVGEKLIITEPAIHEPAAKPLEVIEAEGVIEAVAKPQKKITVRRTKKPIAVEMKEGPLKDIAFGDTTLETRLSKKNKSAVLIPASAYYMNNREIFVSFMTSLFSKYKKNLAAEAATPATCPGEDDVNEFSLMTHQEIVRDYLNIYTPYRGLLLYHGLGSGKTCSSIAIAEGLKSAKPVIIMTPASLQKNYREELKKCGDDLYRKNQFWEFIHTKDKNDEIIDLLAGVLSISTEYIRKHGGAWMVNMSKKSNYDALSEQDKIMVDLQIDQMIFRKYQFINHNGLRATKLLEMTKNNTINPFDNAVIIVDEAHNLISRIVNQIAHAPKSKKPPTAKKTAAAATVGKKKSTIALTLYSLLLKANNAKLVLLSGTPIINYPNEIAVCFNILRGYITSWSFKLDITEQRQINTPFLQSLFKNTILGGNIMDLLEYKPSSTTLVITRNPFGFVNKTAMKDDSSSSSSYAGMHLEIGERGEISDTTFIELVTRILQKNNIKVQPSSVSMHEYKALPDGLEEFKNYFIDKTGKMNNINMFKRRILGLTSYFRSAQESLMPRYVKSNPKDFQVVKIPMSDFQFSVYEEARIQERKLEKQSAKKKKVKQADIEGLYENTTSTYRIFSRAFCNFVFPRPAITRPMPDKKNALGEETSLEDAIGEKGINEDVVDAVTAKEKAERDESNEEEKEGEGEDEGEGAALELGATATSKISYKERIQNALKKLERESDKYLTPEALQVYSPKFLHILENIQDEEHVGIHLIYTQFRALEGVGVLKLVLEANGFTQFKIKKMGEVWELAIPPEDAGKPTFALYTGIESIEEKEIIRNVLNNSWKYVPDSIVKKIKAISPNNTMGEIIKVLMITSSGAEGISLKNVRYVHITEPYWHPVRTEQVIGRARRICSHQSLPEALRTVNVFLYLMTFSEKQLSSDDTIELRLHDKSRKDGLTPVSTDETLYEIASAKEEISTNILQAVKETSIDCALHIKSNTAEKLQCFTFGSNNTAKFAFEPSYENEQSDAIADKNKNEVKWAAKEFELDGTKYALKPVTNEVYDLDSYLSGRPVKVGDLLVKGKGAAATYELKFI